MNTKRLDKIEYDINPLALLQKYSLFYTKNNISISKSIT